MGSGDVYKRQLQECVCEYRRRGNSLQDAMEIFYNNPVRFLGQNPKFDLPMLKVEEMREEAEELVEQPAEESADLT